MTNAHTHTLYEERIVSIPGRVLLRLEKCIKVPERALNEVIGWHLSKSAEGAIRNACGKCVRLYIQSIR